MEVYNTNTSTRDEDIGSTAIVEYPIGRYSIQRGNNRFTLYTGTVCTLCTVNCTLYTVHIKLQLYKYTVQ